MKQCWKTEDGQVFDSEDAAADHEMQLEKKHEIQEYIQGVAATEDIVDWTSYDVASFVFDHLGAIQDIIYRKTEAQNIEEAGGG